jgi:DNA-binding response OmpR family regulator
MKAHMLDLRERVVEELTAKELKVLQLFQAHAGEVLSRDRLLNEVWGYNYYGPRRQLRHINHSFFQGHILRTCCTTQPDSY